MASANTYQGREIAQVMGWQAASWLERAEREQEERTSVLITELGLKPGMVMADVGAGSGYLSRRMAPLTPGGRSSPSTCRPRCLRCWPESRDPRYANIEPLLGAADNTHLARGQR